MRNYILRHYIQVIKNCEHKRVEHLSNKHRAYLAIYQGVWEALFLLFA